MNLFKCSRWILCIVLVVWKCYTEMSKITNKYEQTNKYCQGTASVIIFTNGEDLFKWAEVALCEA